MSMMDRAPDLGSPLTILIADDHWVVRESLKQVAQGLDSNLRIEEAGGFNEALAVLQDNPDVGLLLIDLVMPGFTEMEGLRLIRSNYPSIPIVIVSVHEDPHYVLRAIQHGVIGYIPKSSGPEEIQLALQRVLAGEVAFPRNLIARGWSEQPPPETPPAPDAARAGLSRRESEILVLLGSGCSIQDIAGQLEISRQTVRVHLGNAMRKLDLRTREAAIRYAVENGEALAQMRDRA
ncbi:response regulator transcription factor [Pseudogemmobacter humi]|uniref:Transcriptional regulatory protein DegU n=1 Tax=Pseudogemmobacter humi TaxID=2483812 RepID=A0A3P5WMX0_9RHOB|nr:response regulator transcription factor [Pseudogemmobacter humi]VDC24853.1 Transcriptional regulatory protein DegU [Pseudogemmobacter humi]